MFGGKLKKLFSKKDKDKDKTKEDKANKDLKNSYEKQRSQSDFQEFTIKRIKNDQTIKESKQQEQAQDADNWDGFLESREASKSMKSINPLNNMSKSQIIQQVRTKPQPETQIIKIVEQKPNRKIQVNQSIFAAMAAEREQLHDIEEKKGDSSSSSDFNNMIVEMENPNDLTDLIISHRGANNSDDDPNSPHMRDSFISKENNSQNRIPATFSDDLNVFEVVNSPSPTKLTQSIRNTTDRTQKLEEKEKEALDPRRASMRVQSNLGSAFIEDYEIFAQNNAKNKRISGITTPLQFDLIHINTPNDEKNQQKFEQKDEFSKSLEESNKLTSQLTNNAFQQNAYARKGRQAVTNVNDFKKEDTNENFDKEKETQNEEEEENEKIDPIYKVMMRQNTAVVRRKASIISEKDSKKEDDDDFFNKSYDSEDSLDKLDDKELFVYRPDLQKKEIGEDQKNNQQTLEKQSSFLTDLVSTNNRMSESNRESEIAKREIKFDIFKLINKNEHLFIKYAEKKLVENKTFVMERAQKLKKASRSENITTQRVLGGPCLMRSISGELDKLRAKLDQKATCTLVTDEVILLGTSAGVLWAFERDSEKLWGKFFEDDKAYRGNAITCMDVHPLRTEYVILGFQKGQLILIDLTEIQKSKKVVKDHHKSASIVSAKFCDYIKERENTLAQQLMIAEMEKQGAPIEQIQKIMQNLEVEDKQCWMIVSTDVQGRVIVTTIQNLAFGLCTADKITIIDPTKTDDQIDKIQQRKDGSPLCYPVLQCRFYNKMYPQGYQNDSRTLIACGSCRDVIIYEVLKEKWIKKFVLARPNQYVSENMQGIVTFTDEAPCLCWGYGRTPCFKDRTYALLAVSWGALVQILILNDISDNQGNEFFLDGHYFIAPGTVYNSPENGLVSDIQIQAMRFLSESLLFIYTSTQDIRVLYTQKFHEQQFQQPIMSVSAQIKQEQVAHSVVVQTEGIEFDKIDNRVKITRIGSTLTKEQCEIELERRNFLECPAQISLYGPRAQQTVHSFNDRIVILTDQGLYNLFHLTWQAYLNHLEQTMQASWIDIFEKAIEFFNGRVKGFKGVVDDNQTRKDMIRNDLKELIHGHIERVIKRWKDEALRKKKAGAPPEQVRDDLKDKLCTLIRMSIELCVEIWDPFFLFNELFQKFVEQEMSIQFAEEIKPYILSGVFSETPIPEAILNFHILQHHHNLFLENLTEQNTSPTSGKTITPQNPAENFEKIIVNLSFNGCQKPYKEELIKFCREHQLSSGLIYLCIQTFDEQGPSVAVAQLCYFYEKACEMEKIKRKNEDEKCSPFSVNFSIKEIQELENMPPNLPKREFIERSSTYLGYKLLWATRLFLLGKKFPKGTFEMVQWNAITHDLIELITQAGIIRTIVEIDAEAYFQIISIVFNNPSKQYSFLVEGRSKVETSNGLVKADKESMTHSLILERLHNYAMKLDKQNVVRQQFLFFVASIAKDISLSKEKEFFFNVTLELLNNSNSFLGYNKLMLNRQMTGKQLYRKLSRQGNDAPDHLKHLTLTEENIEQLLRKSEPLDKEEIDTLVEAMEKTQFDSLKLILYEKQENYIKCVQLLVELNQSSNFLNMKMQDGFAFIIEKYCMLQSRLKAPKEDTPQRYQFDMFEKEIYNRTHQLVRMDAHKSVGLADALFFGDHNTFVQRLNEYPQEQYLYISKLIELKFEEIKTSVQNFTLNRAEPQKSKKWLKILKIHLKLACQQAPDQVVQIIEKNIKENFYPLEDCLKICQQFKQLEACAMITKKIGSYKESIQMYLNLLDRELKVEDLRKELYIFDRERKKKEEQTKNEIEEKRKQMLDEHKLQEMQRQRELMQNMDVGAFTKMPQAQLPDVEKLLPLPAIQSDQSFSNLFRKTIEFKIYCQQKAPNILLFERILSKIEKICITHHVTLFEGNQNVWTTILTSLFKLATNEKIKRKKYCRSFLVRKMIMFVKKTLPFVNFQQMIKSVCALQEKIKWKTVRELVSEVFNDIKAEEGMCVCATGLVRQECKYMEEKMFHVRSTGLLFRYLKCELCKRDVDKTSKESQFTAFVSGYKSEDDVLILFECDRSPQYNHVFHNRCLRVFIEEELKKDKKAGLKQEDILKSLRCPECYKTKQDIGEPEKKMPMMRPNKTPRQDRVGTIVGAKKNSEQKSSGNSSQGDASDISPTTSRRGSERTEDQNEEHILGQQKTLKDWRHKKILDRIKRFDQDDEFDSLSIDDFKKM